MTTRHIQPGETVRLSTGSGREFDATVGMPCSDTKPGHWYCASHPKADVHNNLMMSSHVRERGEHVVVWICHEHGPESAGVIVKA
jgi:hypothetical protein